MKIERRLFQIKDLFDEAGGVAPFVVVPGQYADEVVVDDFGELEVDDGGVRVADDVGGDDGFVGDG